TQPELITCRLQAVEFARITEALRVSTPGILRGFVKQAKLHGGSFPQGATTWHGVQDQCEAIIPLGVAKPVEGKALQALIASGVAEGVPSDVHTWETEVAEQGFTLMCARQHRLIQDTPPGPRLSSLGLAHLPMGQVRTICRCGSRRGDRSPPFGMAWRSRMISSNAASPRRP